MEKEFLSSFVNNCLQNGFITPDQMIQSAKDEVNKLEQEIVKIEALRAQQNNYRAVIKHLGGTDNAKRARKAIKMEPGPGNTLDQYMLDVCVQICDFIERSGKKVAVREVGDAILTREEFSAVLTGIKWLFDRGIITRDDTSWAREISPGKNWGARPKHE